jgi:hypothetical protein
VSDPECPLSELPASQCACPKHRGGFLPNEVEVSGYVFEALYAGVCERCERSIKPGDRISRTIQEPGYVHERCPR